METWADKTKKNITEQKNQSIASTVVTASDVCKSPTIAFNKEDTSEAEYDMPKKRESLENLVQNLTNIVDKLKEQIHDLSNSK
tara:strand:- start:510 stop:758 length:249 start_codon:yes stop_codon:yes gene_type:complete